TGDRNADAERQHVARLFLPEPRVRVLFRWLGPTDKRRDVEGGTRILEPDVGDERAREKSLPVDLHLQPVRFQDGGRRMVRERGQGEFAERNRALQEVQLDTAHPSAIAGNPLEREA